MEQVIGTVVEGVAAVALWLFLVITAAVGLIFIGTLIGGAGAATIDACNRKRS